MAITGFTQRANGETATSSSTAVSTGTWTPAASKWFVIAVSLRSSSGLGSTPSIGGNLSSASPAYSRGIAGNPHQGQQFFFLCKSSASPSSGVTTFTCGGTDTFDGAQIFVAEVTAGSGDVTLVNSYGADAATVAISMAGAEAVFAAFYHRIDDAGTPRTNWTELFDDNNGFTNEVTQETQYRVGGADTAASVTWGKDTWKTCFAVTLVEDEEPVEGDATAALEATAAGTASVAVAADAVAAIDLTAAAQGKVRITGSVAAALDITAAAAASTGVAADIDGALEAAADAQAAVSVPATLDAAIEAGADLTGALAVAADVDAALDVGADVAGSVAVAAAVEGALDIAADAALGVVVTADADAAIEAGADAAAAVALAADMDAALELTADATGAIPGQAVLGGALEITAEAAAKIVIRGSVDAAMELHAVIAPATTVRAEADAALDLGAEAEAALAIDALIAASMEVTFAGAGDIPALDLIALRAEFSAPDTTPILTSPDTTPWLTTPDAEPRVTSPDTTPHVAVPA